MALILGYKYPASILTNTNWRDIERKVGMNDLVFMEHRYPSMREKWNIKAQLKPDQICVIFSANDKPTELLHSTQQHKETN